MATRKNANATPKAAHRTARTPTNPRSPSAARDPPRFESAESPAAVASLTPDPVPAVTLPSPRPGFVTPPGHAYHLNQPKSAMLAHLPQAARELRSFARYEETFGTTVPKAVELVALLEAARDWTALMRATLAWLDYVRPNEGMAWRATLPGLRALKRAFALALRRDASLLTELAGLAAFLGLGKSIARRGVATRKRKAKMAAAASAQVSANGAKAAATPTRRSGLASKTAASAQAPLLKKKSATKLPSRRRKRRA